MLVFYSGGTQLVLESLSGWGSCWEQGGAAIERTTCATWDDSLMYLKYFNVVSLWKVLMPSDQSFRVLFLFFYFSIWNFG